MKKLLPLAIVLVGACSSASKVRTPQATLEPTVGLTEVYATLDRDFPEGDFAGSDPQGNGCNLRVVKEALPGGHRFISIVLSNPQARVFSFRFSDAEGASEARRTTILRDFRNRADGYAVKSEFYGTEGSSPVARKFLNGVEFVKLFGTGDTLVVVREDRSSIVAGTPEWTHSCKFKF